MGRGLSPEQTMVMHVARQRLSISSAQAVDAYLFLAVLEDRDGVSNDNSVDASISRMMRRLESRGLLSKVVRGYWNVTARGAHIELNDECIRKLAAKNLTDRQESMEA